jgi:hypothetical protein
MLVLPSPFCPNYNCFVFPFKDSGIIFYLNFVFHEKDVEILVADFG